MPGGDKPHDDGKDGSDELLPAARRSGRWRKSQVFSRFKRAYHGLRSGRRTRLLIRPGLVVCCGPLFLAAVLPIVFPTSETHKWQNIGGSGRTADVCITPAGPGAPPSQAVAGCERYHESLTQDPGGRSFTHLNNAPDAIVARG
ncbi:hypothetical protein MNEG_2777, partial [Monoraphidium neglectum]